MIDGNLLEKLRVSQLPALMVLVEGRVMHFRGDFKGINAKVIRVFARNVIPSTFLHRINSFNAMKRFLDQTKATNKVIFCFECFTLTLDFRSLPWFAGRATSALFVVCHEQFPLGAVRLYKYCGLKWWCLRFERSAWYKMRTLRKHADI